MEELRVLLRPVQLLCTEMKFFSEIVKSKFVRWRCKVKEKERWVSSHLIQCAQSRLPLSTMEGKGILPLAFGATENNSW